MRVLVVILVATVFIVYASDDEEFQLPSYIDVCYRDDPKLADCLKNDIEKLVPIFKSGSKEFELDSLDPMKFEDLVFEYKSPIIGGRLAFSKISFENLSKIKVSNVKPKMNIPKKFMLDFDGTFPFLNLKGYYNLTGNLLRFPLTVDGFVDIILEQITLHYKIAGEVKTIGEYDFLSLKKFSFRLKNTDLKSAYFKNDNVVYNKPALNRAVKTALNENWRIFMDNILPAVFPVSDKLTTDHFDKFFKRYPYDVIFPKRTRSVIE